MKIDGTPLVFSERKCERCGYTEHLERHHIKYRIDGGTNEESNLVVLCKNCHDYRHAKEAVEEAIKIERQRLVILEHRLELIENLNNPQMILERGYQSYFEQFSRNDRRTLLFGSKQGRAT